MTYCEQYSYCCIKYSTPAVYSLFETSLICTVSSQHNEVLNTFYCQLTHTTLENVELLKHSKMNKNAPTCFGLHGNHLQGAKVSTWLKVTRLFNSRCVKDVQGFVSAMSAYCDCNKGYVCNM